MKNTLPKSDRLTSRVAISQIYDKGKHLNDYPFKIVWLKETGEAGLKVVFSVPKRKFKRAVDRNQIKRKLREAYRKHVHDCKKAAESQNTRVSLFLIYLGKDIPQSEIVDNKIILLLNRLTKEITDK
ncbi:ribonuclease P protein component [Flavobacteriales bacterium]|jgi:ribonuclease P protein component|nr:ribonuclease P [uncultured bacterium]MDC0339321.1 ribonuclease P protein component [Flavobacteriales bacterium]